MSGFIAAMLSHALANFRARFGRFERTFRACLFDVVLQIKRRHSENLGAGRRRQQQAKQHGCATHENVLGAFSHE
jgi:hypothetical protein